MQLHSRLHAETAIWVRTCILLAGAVAVNSNRRLVHHIRCAPHTQLSGRYNDLLTVKLAHTPAVSSTRKARGWQTAAAVAELSAPNGNSVSSSWPQTNSPIVGRPKQMRAKWPALPIAVGCTGALQAMLSMQGPGCCIRYDLGPHSRATAVN